MPGDKADMTDALKLSPSLAKPTLGLASPELSPAVESAPQAPSMPGDRLNLELSEAARREILAGMKQLAGESRRPDPFAAWDPKPVLHTTDRNHAVLQLGGYRLEAAPNAFGKLELVSLTGPGGQKAPQALRDQIVQGLLEDPILWAPLAALAAGGAASAAKRQVAGAGLPLDLLPEAKTQVAGGHLGAKLVPRVAKGGLQGSAEVELDLGASGKAKLEASSGGKPTDARVRLTYETELHKGSRLTVSAQKDRLGRTSGQVGVQIDL